MRKTPEERKAILDSTLQVWGARGWRIENRSVIALRIRNIDEKRGTIHVEKSFTRGTETAPKSGKDRPVPMVEDVSKALATLLLTRGNPRDDELVFPGPTAST